MRIESSTPEMIQGPQGGPHCRRVEKTRGAQDAGAERPAPARADGRLLFAEYLKQEHMRAADARPFSAAQTAPHDPHTTDDSGITRRGGADRNARSGPRLADVSPTREITKQIQVEQTYQVRLHSTLGNMIDILM